MVDPPPRRAPPSRARSQLPTIGVDSCELTNRAGADFYGCGARDAAIRSPPTTPRKEAMVADKPVFLYAAIYDDIPDAEADFDAVYELHAAGLIGTFDAAVIEKQEGKAHVHKKEKPTQHGAWTGIAVGAVAGILFPPSIIGGAIVGGAAGGVIGHLWRGLSRSDLKDLGEGLDEGAAALVVVGESKVGEQIEKAVTRARKVIEKEIDAEADDLKQELQDAEQAATA